MTESESITMKKALTVLFVLILSLAKSNGQSTWIPEGDYRLYSYDQFTPLYGVEYTASLTTSDSTIYTNYVQVIDSFGNFMVPMQPEDYHFADSVGIFGNQTYYSQSDEISLFPIHLVLPNTPTAQTTWTGLAAYKSNYHVEASSSAWAYHPIYQDSVLTISLSVKNTSNQGVISDSLHGAELVYGKTKGLLEFDSYLLFSNRKKEPVTLVYSKDLGLGELPTLAEDVFAYSPGNEIHSLLIKTGPGQIDTTYIRRKTISAQTLGSMLVYSDSIWQITHSHRQTGQNTWAPVQIINKASRVDTDSIRIDQYGYLQYPHANTFLNPLDSSSNRHFFIKTSTSLVAQFELYVSRDLPAAKAVTPNPPYAYVAQYALQEMDEHFVYYLGAGGPYRRYNSIGGGENEYVVYVKNGNVEKGTPHTSSLLNSTRVLSSVQTRLYPNPAKNQVQLQVSQIANWQATIYGIDGKAIQHFAFDGDSQTIDISSLENGMYFIRLTSPEYISTVRLKVNK